MKAILFAGLVLTAVIPACVFVVAGVASGVGLGEVLSALGAQYVASRSNLGMLTGIALLPLALLTLIVWLVRRFAPPGQLVPSLALGGLVPILIVQVWVHFEYWPKFFPDQSRPSWPHGLEFVIGPLFFAPVAMALGLLTAWLVTRVAR